MLFNTKFTSMTPSPDGLDPAAEATSGYISDMTMEITLWWGLPVLVAVGDAEPAERRKQNAQKPGPKCSQNAAKMRGA